MSKNAVMCNLDLLKITIGCNLDLEIIVNSSPKIELPVVGKRN